MLFLLLLLVGKKKKKRFYFENLTFKPEYLGITFLFNSSITSHFLWNIVQHTSTPMVSIETTHLRPCNKRNRRQWIWVGRATFQWNPTDRNGQESAPACELQRASLWRAPLWTRGDSQQPPRWMCLSLKWNKFNYYKTRPVFRKLPRMFYCLRTFSPQRFLIVL